MVVGATNEIGRSCADALRQRGYSVAMTYRAQAPAGDNWTYCDVRDRTSIDKAFDVIESTLGPVQVLVVAAATQAAAPIVALSDSAAQEVLDTNLVGAMRLCRRAARNMVRERWGRIVLISSVAAVHGLAGGSAYAASKSGLVGVARSLAHELGPSGVTVNVVMPGVIATKKQRIRRRWLLAEQAIPLGRYGSARDVGATAAFLASEDAAYITGVVLPVDGGVSMGVAWNG